MAPVRFMTRAEVERLLRPYGGERVKVLQPGLELWVTSWGEHFTLCPEDPAGDGNDRYDFWQLQRAVGAVIGPTMPPALGANGGNPAAN